MPLYLYQTNILTNCCLRSKLGVFIKNFHIFFNYYKYIFLIGVPSCCKCCLNILINNIIGYIELIRKICKLGCQEILSLANEESYRRSKRLDTYDLERSKKKVSKKIDLKVVCLPLKFANLAINDSSRCSVSPEISADKSSDEWAKSGGLKAARGTVSL